MTQISILGCGWLGLPLAKSLIEKGFSINGSTTTSEKIDQLKNNRIEPFLIKVLEDKIEGKIVKFLEKSEILIIDIPPKLRGTSNENFVGKIKNLLYFVEKSTVKKVVFISSTSVYLDSFPFTKYSENTQNTSESTISAQLLEAENTILATTNFETIILRFGGLIGEDRNPIKFLSGKKNIENPEAPINLIHQKDCIKIITSILQEKNSAIWNHVYNVVYPYHPTRKEYYSKRAQDLNLPLPEFVTEGASVGKIISSKKIIKTLNYNFTEKIQ